MNLATLARPVLVMLTLVALRAEPIHTQIPPFTQAGLSLVKNGLVAQTAPVVGPRAVAIVQFGLDQLDPATTQFEIGSTSASVASAWPEYPGVTGEALVENGTLGVRSSIAPTDFTGIDLQVHSRANFLDALTIEMTGLPSGTAGFLHLSATVDGVFDCDRPGGICNTGFLFGYGPGTLGYNEFVHTIGGEQPARGPFSTTQSLVGLPFLSGQPFNLVLELMTTARLNDPAGFNSADFLHSLQITGISVRDASGAPVSFEIASGSGLEYQANGISAVPEPGTFALTVLALGCCVAVRRIRCPSRGR